MDRQIREGMSVRSWDGKDLGTVTACFEDDFRIEKGLFFPVEAIVRYQDVAEVKRSRVLLKKTLSELRVQQQSEAEEEASVFESSQVEPGMTFETRVIPVAEERLIAEKRLIVSGRVRVSKRVRTERAEVTVPVIREEVHIERVPLGSDRELSAADSAFKERSYTLTLREELVEVAKKPVVREEIRIAKSEREEDQVIEGEVRREHVEIDESRDKDRTGAA